MIYVFKTSVRTKGQAKKLAPYIDNILKEATWNFDLQDRDRILRIDSDENIVTPILNMFKDHYLDCAELE